MEKVFIILASFLLLLTGCNNSKVETIEETYIKELGYKVVSYEGELDKYTLDKDMLKSGTENIPYQQIWSLQEIKPEDYFGKEIITKKYIVKNHPLQEICEETLLYLMINEEKIIGGYSFPNNDSVGGVYSIDGKTIKEITDTN
ncbi:hypothetical protein [Clostridium sp.]|uniref:hypothetical protein n=1 Tax=Clostridium sp. TaxID=1506 RepID=UPI002619518C|nr:hypothetical protein [Clostridium sp.]